MDRRIRWLGLIFIACFLLLFLQLNNWQVRQASTLQTNTPKTQPVASDVFNQQRGMIITSDYQVIAHSVPSDKKWLRVYPHGSLFADVTGYFDPTALAVPYGLEAEYESYLAMHQSPVQSIVLTQHDETNDVVSTISYKLQLAAANALGGQQGAVVALDPKTGAILAMYGNPTYDPNLLATWNAKDAAKYFASLSPNSGSSPLVNAATDVLHPPGSTFKIITSAAVWDHYPHLATINWPYESKVTIPGTNGLSVHNFGFESCGGNFYQILTASCDTTFALIGLALKPPTLVKEAEAFGFNNTPPLDLPADVAASQIASAQQMAFPFSTAISAIGQFDDAASALQMALVSAGIANGGVIMTPHLLDHVLNQQGQVVAAYAPHPWREATSKSTAALVRQMMLGPTNDENGTTGGTLTGVLSAGNLGGVYVAGKTGTAETVTSGNDCGGEDWTTAFGPAQAGQTPTIAVAAWVKPSGSASCDGQGATVAGPVVRAVLQAALNQG